MQCKYAILDAPVDPSVARSPPVIEGAPLASPAACCPSRGQLPLKLRACGGPLATRHELIPDRWNLHFPERKPSTPPAKTGCTSLLLTADPPTLTAYFFLLGAGCFPGQGFFNTSLGGLLPTPTLTPFSILAVGSIAGRSSAHAQNAQKPGTPACVPLWNDTTSETATSPYLPVTCKCYPESSRSITQASAFIRPRWMTSATTRSLRVWPVTNESSRVLLFIFRPHGGPGSGKGTQCEKIVAKYGFTHLSTGDLLRNEVQSGSQRGKQLTAIMERGELVPMEVVLDLLTEAIINNVTTSKGYLIDGYPRELVQGLTFEEKVAECSVILNFDVSPEVMTARLLHRAKTSGRADDNEETIKKRLQTFQTHSKPVVDHFQSKCLTICAEKDPDEIFKEVESCLDALVTKK
uniref:adenylate kinase n=1 Tax=Timema bartmani TaxID=61472 RepID=A0A7R9FAQ8_9NEOP|nr:unnamed protein product [Timema bartmani]